MSKYSFRAVIFDLDGVVTDTASTHFSAWKQVFDAYLQSKNAKFSEFTLSDYLRYVDGKPRYDGVQSFLKSRGIDLIYGNKTDSGKQETVCGIGNRKYKIVRKLLQQGEFKVYDSTIRFIKKLRQQSIKTAIISSSKSCRYILRRAGLLGLFEVVIEGIASERLGIQGKPAPDIFLAAASRLGVHPEETVIAEDASSGIAAARNGGFGLALGIARSENTQELLVAGADLVVPDLRVLKLSDLDLLFSRRPRDLSESWSRSDQSLAQSLSATEITVSPSFVRTARSLLQQKNKKLVFFLDYDGTLTPIVDRPEDALLSSEMRRLLRKLAREYTVAIVSGRDRQVVEDLVGIRSLVYLGDHGFDIRTRRQIVVQEQAATIQTDILRVSKIIKKELGSIAGVIIEKKKLSIAIHYRLVEPSRVSGLRAFIQKLVAQYPQLRLMNGKKVFEIMPNVDWDKGRAILWLRDELGLSWSDSTIVYIGDDTTDEDAFRVLRGRGVGILVSDRAQDSRADFQLRDPEAVFKFFKKLTNEK